MRTWLVGFGIGAPVLFLSNKDVWAKLRAPTSSVSRADVSRGGRSLQVGLGLLYRSACGISTLKNRQPRENDSPVPMVERLSDLFWPEITVAIVTLALFGWSTWKIVEALCA